MKNIIFATILIGSSIMAQAQSKVYMTREISPEALVKIYKALDRPADGKAYIHSAGNMAPTIDHAAAIGLGSLQYEIIDLDKQ